ncbi:MAG: CCA tRNA nucleotidyltransferase [Lachnospiraceae bacterium]|nr:CCA tRNA nucleotidyltransferase [Lachnospiraceae bacterium]
MKIKIPENAEYILHTLENNGYEGYVVGGCVRDMLLGRKPGDWDITTSAKPEQVKALFRRTIDTGIAHGTVTVMFGTEGYEVTTYRMDGRYEDHRHPKEVVFTPSLYEDLKRRDFTINAMAYNPRTGLVDEFDGMKDMERRCIRCVGEASERFEEDALRMLRGIRFAGQLLFELEPATVEAIREKAATLTHVSAERIRTELTKLLLSPGADRLMLAAETGLSRYFLPEFNRMLATPQNNPHHRLDVGRHSLEAVCHIHELWEEMPDLEKKARTALVYGALLHDVAKPECRTTDEAGIDHFYSHNERGAEEAAKILRRLKFDNETISMVSQIIKYHDRRYENCLEGGAYSPKGKKAMRRLASQAGYRTMPLLFLLQKADLLSQSDFIREEKLARLEAGIRCFREIREAGDALNIKELAIGGREIMALGVKPGPEIGGILRKLLDIVLEEPQKNTAEELTSLAVSLVRQK